MVDAQPAPRPDPTTVVVAQRAADRAPLIANGVIQGEGRAVDTVAGVFTVREFEVTSTVVGEASQSVLVMSPGGTSADGITLVVPGQPSFVAGDHVQLALAPVDVVDPGLGAEDFGRPELDAYVVVAGQVGTSWLTPRSTAAAAPLLGGSGDFTLSGPSWESMPISYRVNTSGAPAGAVGAVTAAARTWADDPSSDVRFSYLGTTSLTPRSDENSVVIWGTIPATSDPDTIAVTTTSFIGTRLVSFDIVFNRSKAWFVGAQSNSFDIESVALHELGHGLGLGHTPRAGQVMYERIVSNTLRRELQNGDLGGVRALYPQTQPTPVPTATPRPTSTPTLVFTTPTPVSDPVIRGDVDCDGRISLNDGRAIAQYVVGTRVGRPNCPLPNNVGYLRVAAANVDGRAGVTLVDARAVALCAIGAANQSCFN